MTSIRELLSRLDPKKRSKAVERIGYDPTGMSGRGDLDAVPTPTERRLWLSQQLNKDSAFYNISCAYRITGELDVAALVWAIDYLTRRHDALRTTFLESDGNLRVSVAPVGKVAFTEVDLAGLPDQDATIAVRLQLESSRAFDLSRAPLFRSCLYRTGQQEYVLHLLMHHIVADQWSLEVFRRELFALYEARHHDEVPYLPPAGHSRGYSIPADEIAGDLAYWRRMLAGVPSYPDLPFDRPPARASRWLGQRLYLPYGELGEPLGQFAKRNGCTLFMVLMAGFALAFARWISGRDFCLGTRIAGRSRPETQNVIGFFVNLLAVRFRVPEEASAVEWIGLVRENLLGAFDHQDTPFETVLGDLSIERDALITPLIPVVITHQNIPVAGGAEAAGLKIEPLRFHNGTAKCELDLAFEGDGANLGLVVEYRSDVFDEQTIRALLDEYRLILARMIEPGASLSSIWAELDTNGAAKSALTGPQIQFSEEAIDARIRGLADANPQGVAVWDRSGATSFGTIELRSRQLATSLTALQLDGAPVSLYMERSADWLIAALACLRANIVYVPLDPDYPEEFTREVVRQSGAAIIVADPALLERALAIGGARAISVDQLSAISKEVPFSPPDNMLRQPAYIAFSSGSTGEPKGVVVEQRQVLNCLDSIAAQHPFADDEVYGQMTSVSFVPSVKEWLAGLFAGLPVVVIGKDQSLDMNALDALVSRHRVTRLNMVPSRLRLVVEHKKQHPEAFASLRAVVTAGALLDRVLAADFHRAFSKCRLLNNYGCTELNDICYAEVVRAEGEFGEFVPAGKPIANLAVHILDRDLNPVRPGAIGEICVTGAAVGMGYHGSPAETAERFCPYDIATADGERLFRTGDYGCIRNGNELELHGRRDQQLKINGCRVDVRHVEAVLQRHPRVDRCVVLVRETVKREPYLIAYIAPEIDPQKCVGVRRYLAENLPRYMVPSVIVAIDTFPMLPNGKIDRMSFPAPVAQPGMRDQWSETEKRIASIWTEILGHSPESENTDFFVIGGNSLHLTLCVARLKQCFDVEVPLNDLFAASTVALQADLVDKLGAARKPKH